MSTPQRRRARVPAHLARSLQDLPPGWPGPFLEHVPPEDVPGSVPAHEPPPMPGHEPIDDPARPDSAPPVPEQEPPPGMSATRA